MQMANSGMAMHSPKKDCNNCTQRNCCNQHGDYLLKENLKPGFDLKFAPPMLLIHEQLVAYQQPYSCPVNSKVLSNSNAPPPKTGRLLSIQFRSLQI
jgi:hypothetical protein